MAQNPITRTTLELEPVDGAVSKDAVVEIIQNGTSVRTTVSELTKRDLADFKVTTGLAIDPASTDSQVFRVDNSASTAKTITLGALPALRAMTLVIVISGNAGVITWPGTIVWDKNTQPKPGAIRTVVVILWDGTALTGSQGATA